MFSNKKDKSKVVLLQHNDRDGEDLIEQSTHTIIQIDRNDSEESRPRWKTTSCDIKLVTIILAIFLAVAISFLIIIEFSSVYSVLNSNGNNEIHGAILESNTLLCDTPECKRSSTNLLETMDFNVNPCDDFYQYACGNWASHYTRPDEFDSWGWHNILQVKINNDIQKFFESFPKSDEPAIISQSRIMYKSCITADKQAESGKKLVREYLSKEFDLPDVPAMIIQGKNIGDGFDWIKTIAKVKKLLDINIIFEFDVVPHPSNGKKEFKFNWPANNPMDEPMSIEEIEDYISFGLEDPHSVDPEILKNLANRIFKVEQNFTSMLEKTEMTSDGLLWFTKLKSLKLQDARRIVENILGEDVTNHKLIFKNDTMNYYNEVVKFISKVDKTDLALYIWWKIIKEMLRPIETHYELSGQDLTEYCVNEVNEAMGIVMSYAIAQPNFHNTTKPKVQQMFDRIRESFRDLIEKSDWMSDESKDKILKKSQAMKMKTGFPVWIFNITQLNAYYGNIEFNENSLLENLIKIRSLKLNRKLKSLTSTDNVEWDTLPSEVDANYVYQTNSMTIPQAVLQFPFFGLGLEALNYGATDLAHEFMHGFDNTSIDRDENGNYNPSWLNLENEYNKRIKLLADQYSSFSIISPETNEYIDGEKTLDENIADNLGLLLAYRAYKNYVKDQGEEKMLLPGFEKFTNEQLFFIAYGNKWCNSITPEQSKIMLEINDHSPNKYRVNGAVTNSKEFQKAFQCSTESKMVSKNVWQIW